LKHSERSLYKERGLQEAIINRSLAASAPRNQRRLFVQASHTVYLYSFESNNSMLQLHCDSQWSARSRLIMSCAHTRTERPPTRDRSRSHCRIHKRSKLNLGGGARRRVELPSVVCMLLVD
jgi:hypothetical protein